MEKNRVKNKVVLQVWQVCVYHFSRWRNNKRILMAFLLAAVISFLLTEKVMAFSAENGTTIQMFEPFIWVFGDGTSILLCAMVASLLFADMPFLSSSVPYYLIRIRVRTWVMGQLLYMICSTFIYTMFILIITILLCSKNAFSGNVWSPTAALLVYSDYGGKLSIPVTLKTFEMSKPYACAVTIFFLLLLYVLLAVLIMFLVTIWKGQLLGIMSPFAFHLFGILLNPEWIGKVFQLSEKEFYRAKILCGWISPVRQVTYYWHNFGFDLLPRLQDTYLIFSIAIMMFILAIIRKMRRYSFHFLGTEEE
ncbi:MAG: hypothetical protein K0S76_1553 [Herbinix sp.]|nr:hypothetical protein [Herbinix sp.]